MRYSGAASIRVGGGAAVSRRPAPSRLPGPPLRTPRPAASRTSSSGRERTRPGGRTSRRQPAGASSTVASGGRGGGATPGGTSDHETGAGEGRAFDHGLDRRIGEWLREHHDARLRQIAQRKGDVAGLQRRPRVPGPPAAADRRLGRLRRAASTGAAPASALEVFVSGGREHRRRVGRHRAAAPRARPERGPAPGRPRRRQPSSPILPTSSTDCPGGMGRRDRNLHRQPAGAPLPVRQTQIGRQSDDDDHSPSSAGLRLASLGPSRQLLPDHLELAQTGRLEVGRHRVRVADQDDRHPVGVDVILGPPCGRPAP